MATVKITALSAVTASDLTDAALLPIVSSHTGTATTYKVTVAELRTELFAPAATFPLGVTVTAGGLTVSAGGATITGTANVSGGVNVTGGGAAVTGNFSTGSGTNTLGDALKLLNTSAPATPTGGGMLYCESGALKYKGTGGTITTLGAA